MTRRTDWAEYAYQDAPRMRGEGGDDAGSARLDGDAYGDNAGRGTDGGHGRVESYGTGGSNGDSGSYGDDRPYGESKSPGGGEWSDDDSVRGSGPSGGRSQRRGG